jgi:hypothetical protein
MSEELLRSLQQSASLMVSALTTLIPDRSIRRFLEGCLRQRPHDGPRCVALCIGRRSCKDIRAGKAAPTRELLAVGKLIVYEDIGTPSSYLHSWRSVAFRSSWRYGMARAEVSRVGKVNTYRYRLLTLVYGYQSFEILHKPKQPSRLM